jgi:hypothetical protein
LEKEKAENDQRLLAGIQWAAAIDRKRAELRRAKKSC